MLADWWDGWCNGQYGEFPANHVALVSPADEAAESDAEPPGGVPRRPTDANIGALPTETLPPPAAVAATPADRAIPAASPPEVSPLNASQQGRKRANVTKKPAQGDRVASLAASISIKPDMLTPGLKTSTGTW